VRTARLALWGGQRCLRWRTWALPQRSRAYEQLKERAEEDCVTGLFSHGT
jgi:hypothetical protein